MKLYFATLLIAILGASCGGETESMYVPPNIDQERLIK